MHPVIPVLPPAQPARRPGSLAAETVAVHQAEDGRLQHFLQRLPTHPAFGGSTQW